MKILIVSDTHRRNGNLQEVIEQTAPFDMLIHLGDGEGSEELITSWCLEQNQNCEVHMVLGNNDFFSCLDREKEISIGPYSGISHTRPFLQCVGRAGASGGRSALQRRRYRHVWTHPQAFSGRQERHHGSEPGQLVRSPARREEGPAT